jgi:hypothetical protein
MATGKDQPQPVVAHPILPQHVFFCLGQLLFQFSELLQFLALGIESAPAPQQVHSLVMCRGYQPRSRILRDSLLRPLLQRYCERFLHHFFRQVEAAKQANERGQDPP